MNHIKQITPALSEIKTGTPGFKIGSQFFVGGIGGNFIPGMTGTDVSDTTAIASDVLTGKYFYTSSGVRTAGTGSGATNFYKCASVSSGTWTGYKAVQDSTTKIWSFEQSLTTDTLTFDSSKSIPTVNSIYTADALVQIKKLFMGNFYILYIPLTSNESTAPTGQTLTYNGSIDFGEVSGHKCGSFQNNEYVQTSLTTTGVSEKTICMKMIIDDTNDWKTFLTYGDFYKRIAGNYDADYYDLYWEPGQWYSYILVFNGTQLKEYLNGTLKATRSYTYIPNGTFQVGGDSFRGKIFDVKVFPTALTDDRIAEESIL